ncbi:hypothetical protein GCM10011574_19480 [Microbispora bryophytorum]|uniref:Uncharacterized protein n=1 Tax=Microbispora bryophytorum TaxID=1460882 RepID=A0A8H9LCJ9_9ACTN|nr:hypothetical protein GCM10011574_19480 [Microbispora bryophytorum]
MAALWACLLGSARVDVVRDARAPTPADSGPRSPARGAICETVVGLREAVAAVMAREREHPLGFVDEGRLTHAGLNAAVALLGMAPVTDEE